MALGLLGFLVLALIAGFGPIIAGVYLLLKLNGRAAS